MFIYQTHWSCKKKRSKLNEIHIVTVLILNKVNINKEFHQWYSTVSVYIMQCNNWSEHSDLTTSWHFNTGIIHTRAQLVCRLSELKIISSTFPSILFYAGFQHKHPLSNISHVHSCFSVTATQIDQIHQTVFKYFPQRKKR